MISEIDRKMLKIALEEASKALMKVAVQSAQFWLVMAKRYPGAITSVCSRVTRLHTAKWTLCARQVVSGLTETQFSTPH